MGEVADATELLRRDDGMNGHDLAVGGGVMPT